MKDQKKLWNSLHLKGDLLKYSLNPTDFAREVAKLINHHTKLLELGCGVGNDSYFFASQRHTVLATDFSEIVIKQNIEKYHSVDLLTFEVIDMSKTLYTLNDRSFDLVYARLSLHYFTDKMTRSIINEVYRILKPNGLFCFLCKSIKDPLYGQGNKVETDVYEFNNHIRHFFSETYLKDLLNKNFKIIKIESGKENFYDKKSKFIKVIVRKKIK